jgi:hypothetical protein
VQSLWFPFIWLTVLLCAILYMDLVNKLRFLLLLSLLHLKVGVPTLINYYSVIKKFNHLRIHIWINQGMYWIEIAPTHIPCGKFFETEGQIFSPLTMREAVAEYGKVDESDSVLWNCIFVYLHFILTFIHNCYRNAFGRHNFSLNARHISKVSNFKEVPKVCL